MRAYTQTRTHTKTQHCDLTRLFISFYEGGKTQKYAYEIAVLCVPLSTFEPNDRFSQNVVRKLRHWRLLEMRNS